MTIGACRPVIGLGRSAGGMNSGPWVYSSRSVPQIPHQEIAQADLICRRRVGIGELFDANVVSRVPHCSFHRRLPQALSRPARGRTTRRCNRRAASRAGGPGCPCRPARGRNAPDRTVFSATRPQCIGTTTAGSISAVQVRGLLRVHVAVAAVDADEHHVVAASRYRLSGQGAASVSPRVIDADAAQVDDVADRVRRLRACAGDVVRQTPRTRPPPAVCGARRIDLHDAAGRDAPVAHRRAHMPGPDEEGIGGSRQVRDGLGVQVIFVRVRGEHDVGLQLGRRQRNRRERQALPGVDSDRASPRGTDRWRQRAVPRPSGRSPRRLARLARAAPAGHAGGQSTWTMASSSVSVPRCPRISHAPAFELGPASLGRKPGGAWHDARRINVVLSGVRDRLMLATGIGDASEQEIDSQPGYFVDGNVDGRDRRPPDAQPLASCRRCRPRCRSGTARSHLCRALPGSPSECGCCRRRSRSGAGAGPGVRACACSPCSRVNEPMRTSCGSTGTPAFVVRPAVACQPPITRHQFALAENQSNATVSQVEQILGSSGSRPDSCRPPPRRASLARAGG